MASASGEKKGTRRQTKTHRAPRKARSPKSTPLNAQRDATRKRELQNRPESALNGDAEMAQHLVPTVSTCLG
jgi:hypothetical protein